MQITKKQNTKPIRVYLPELKQIATRHGGVLKAADVVAFARNKKTKLHDAFDWDDTRAAHRWRLHQARNLIRVSCEIVQETKADFRAFVSLKPDRSASGGGYRRIGDVLSDATMRASLLNEAVSQVAYWRRRYATLVELADIFAAIDKTVAKHKCHRTN